MRCLPPLFAATTTHLSSPGPISSAHARDETRRLPQVDVTTQHPNYPNPNQVDVTTQLRPLPSPDVMRLVQGRPATLSAEQLIGEIEWPDTAEAQEVKEGDEHSVAEEAASSDSTTCEPLRRAQPLYLPISPHISLGCSGARGHAAPHPPAPTQRG